MDILVFSIALREGFFLLLLTNNEQTVYRGGLDRHAFFFFTCVAFFLLVIFLLFGRKRVLYCTGLPSFLRFFLKSDVTIYELC